MPESDPSEVSSASPREGHRPGGEIVLSPPQSALDDFARTGGRLVALTGAGVSTESGVPDFRGANGYWTQGSTNWFAQDLATRQAFARHRDVVWSWYLYRRNLCATVEPNEAHHALVRLDRALGERFVLITQNVDGLHRRAGSTEARTFAIHGDIGLMRCFRECRPDALPIPAGIGPTERGEAATAEDLAALTCPSCGGTTRPHVLWFDECYDELNYRWDSSLHAAEEASLLLVAGTSGQTNLPRQIVALATRRRIPIFEVNLERSPFSAAAEASGGASVQARCGEVLPLWAARILGENS
jgi:NAD-dependent deacetylase